MMLAHIYLKRGSVVPKHSHENEQLTYVLEGTLRFHLGDDLAEIVDVRPARCCTSRPTCRTAREALEDTLDVDILQSAARRLAGRVRRVSADARDHRRAAGPSPAR
jgi:hypothetical protein